MPASPGVSGSLHEILNDLPSEAVAIRPHGFVVAWHGVLTLAFEAWPRSLAAIKRRVNDLPEFRASSENFGTRWPKATLAARRDDAPPFTRDELRDLTALCRGFDAQLRALGPVPLARCSVAAFASRSLEHVLCRVDYPLAKEEEDDASPSTTRRDGEQEYDEDSYEVVRRVVRETDRLDEYIEKVNAPGHRWGGHYDTVWTEATLVCFLADGSAAASPSTSRLLAAVASFREEVDALLPGAYVWMPEEALHLSLRALDNRSNVRRRSEEK